MLHTPFCELVGVAHPIVQTGMGWVSGAALTAATSAAGGLRDPRRGHDDARSAEEAVRDVRQRTEKPFGVNFRADQPDLDERIAFVVGEGVRLVSFAGAPTKDAIGRLHDAGVLVMPTVGARRHAEKMLDWGVDAVIAQGGEGGGHTGTVPTSLLLPQVSTPWGRDPGAGGRRLPRRSRAGRRPGLGGGRRGHGHPVPAHAESRVPDVVKQRYLDAAVTDTVVTTALDGAPQRVIRTAVVDQLERSSTSLGCRGRWLAAWRFAGPPAPRSRPRAEGLAMRKHQDLTWSQLAMAANAPMLIKAAMVDGNPTSASCRPGRSPA